MDTNEPTKKRKISADDALSVAVPVLLMLIFTAIIVGVLMNCWKLLRSTVDYTTGIESIRAGVISDKEIVNAHTKGGNFTYIPSNSNYYIYHNGRNKE